MNLEARLSPAQAGRSASSLCAAASRRLRRVAGCDGRGPRRTGARFSPRSASCLPDRARHRAERSQPARARDGHRARHLRRSDGSRESAGTSISSRSFSPRRMAPAGGGAVAARAPVQRHPRRRLWRAAAAARGPDPADADFLRPRPISAPATACSRSRASAVLCRRSRARRRTATGASSTITPKPLPASAMRSPTASCTRTSPATSSKPAMPCGWRRSSSACRRA